MTEQTNQQQPPIKPAQALKPIDEVRNVIHTLAPQFKAALPAHIQVDRFQRVVMTAIGSSPDILQANRNSLYAACLKSAQDGLLPDGREAALVIFNKKKGDTWEKHVQYMPMVAGILKKIRNSGELKELSAHVVYTGDTFDYWLDDTGEHLTHRPKLDGARGDFRLVYAIATTKDGGRYIEVMTVEQVNQVREVSRAKDGPWKEWYPEMARKTVIRRLSKRLPMSTDVDDLLKRDDELYELPGALSPRPALDMPLLAPAGEDGKANKRPRRLQAVAEATPPQTSTAPAGDAAAAAAAEKPKETQPTGGGEPEVL